MLSLKSKMIVAAYIVLGPMMMSAPAYAQELADCSSGKVWLPSDNKSIKINGFCEHVQVAGNRNAVSAQGIGKLTLMGDGNDITAGKIKELIEQGNGNTTRYLGKAPVLRSMGERNIQTRLGEATTPVRRPSNSVSTQPTRKKKRTAVGSNKKKILPSTGKGIKKSQLHSVLYLGNLQRPKILVMLKDGTARYNPSTSVEHLNVAADKAKYPKAWRHWRRSGGKLQLRNFGSSKWVTVKKQKAPAIKPARSGFKLSGKWKHARSTMTMTGGSAFFANYIFSPQGRYESSSSSILGASTPGISSSIGSGTCDKTGKRSASSSTSSGGGAAGSSSRGKGCGAANIGQYIIKGYTIEFHAENGKVYRKPFYYIKKDLIFIGHQWFSSGL